MDQTRRIHRLALVHHLGSFYRTGWVVLLVFASAITTSCATTMTRNKAEDGSKQTLIRFEFGGRILNHGATASYIGPNWSMHAGDTAEELSIDPEVAKAIAQGATSAVLETIKRIGMPLP